jgi:hypothetical protein
MFGGAATNLTSEHEAADSRWFRIGGPVFWLAVWGVAGCLIFAFQLQLPSMVWLVALLGHGLWGASIAMVCLIQAWRSGRTFLLFLAAVVWPFMLIGLSFAQPQLEVLGSRAAFPVVRPAYDRIVADVAEMRIAHASGRKWMEREGVIFTFVPDNRDLVVFRWKRDGEYSGIAVVHDSGGRLVNASDANWHQIRSELVEITGRSMASCERIARPHYYFCRFGRRVR